MSDRPTLGRILFRHTAEAVLLVDPEGLVVQDINPAAETLFRTTGRELAGRRLDDLLDFDGPVSDFEDVLRHRTVRVQLPGNRVRTFKVTAEQFGPGDACLMLGCSAGQATAEADTNDPETSQRYEQVVRNSPVCIHEIELDGTLSSMNAAGLSMVGLNDESEIIGVEYLSFVAPSDLPRVRNLMNRAMRGEIVPQFEFETVDGRVLRSCFVPLTCVSDRVERLMGLTEDVTRERQAHADRRLRDHAFATSADGILIVDAQAPDQPVIYCNPAFERLSGYTRDEILGHNCRFLQDDDRNQPGRFALREAIDKGVDTTVELRNYRKDGSMFWSEIRLSPVPDEAGEITHFVAVQHDISARKEAEEELLLSRERLARQYAEVALLYRTAPVGLCVLDTDLKYVRINEWLARMNGLSVADHPGKTLRDVAPDLADKLEPTYRRVLETRQPATNVEWTRTAKDGSVCWFLDSCHPVEDAAGEVIGISVVVQEISELKRAETEVRIRDAAIADSATPTAFGDDNFRLTSVNQAFLDLFGFDDESEVIGQPNTMFGSAPLMLPEINEELARTGEWIGETRSARRDGEVVELLVRASVLRDDAGQRQCFTATFFDITERKRTEAELRLTKFSVDSCHTAIFWIRRDAGFDYVNQAAADMLGRTCEELVGMTVHDIDPAYPPERWPAYWSQVERERTITFESRVQHRDGSMVPVELTTSLLEYGGEEFVFAFATNIAERKRAEAALIESEANLLALIENTPDNILSIDTSYRILTVNKALRDATRSAWGAELRTGVNILDQLPQDVAAIWKQRYDRALAGERFVIEERSAPD